jgi:hypothetical protein
MLVHACPVTVINFKHTFEHVSANYGGYDYVWARNDKQKTQYDAMKVGDLLVFGKGDKSVHEVQGLMRLAVLEAKLNLPLDVAARWGYQSPGGSWSLGLGMSQPHAIDVDLESMRYIFGNRRPWAMTMRPFTTEELERLREVLTLRNAEVAAAVGLLVGD